MEKNYQKLIAYALTIIAIFAFIIFLTPLKANACYYPCNNYNPSDGGGTGAHIGTTGNGDYNPSYSGGTGDHVGTTGNGDYNPSYSGGTGDHVGTTGTNVYNPSAGGGAGDHIGTTGTNVYNPSNGGGTNTHTGSNQGSYYRPSAGGGINTHVGSYTLNQSVIIPVATQTRAGITSATINRNIVSVKNVTTTNTVAKKNTVKKVAVVKKAEPQLLACINPASVGNNNLTANALFGSNGFLSLSLTQWLLLLFLILLIIYLWKRNYSKNTDYTPPIQHSFS